MCVRKEQWTSLLYSKTACDIWEIIDTAFSSFSIAPCSPPFFLGVTPLSQMKCSSQGCHPKRSGPEGKVAMKEIRRWSHHPSHCLDHDINSTFNSVVRLNKWSECMWELVVWVCVHMRGGGRQRNHRLQVNTWSGLCTSIHLVHSYVLFKQIKVARIF